MSELAEKLYDYSQLDGSELGEMLAAMCQLSKHEGQLGVRLRSALEREMRLQLEWLESNCEVEVIEETSRRKTRVLRFINQ